MGMKLNTLIQELNNALGEHQAKHVKRLLVRGYLTREIHRKIAPKQLPPDLIERLDNYQQKRFRCSRFSYKHSLHDIAAHLRHSLRLAPNDPIIKEHLTKIRIPFALLKHMVNDGEIIDFYIKLVDVSRGIIDVSFVLLPKTDPTKLLEQIDAVMRTTPH
jgi:hypothetical protein